MVLGAFRMLLNQCSQRLPWTHFQEDLVWLAKKGLQPIGEAHRLAHVFGPVIRIRRFGGCNPIPRYVR